MRKKIISKTNVVISLIMCLLLVFNADAFAVKISPDAIGVDEISISPRCGIVEGKTAQMRATLSPESAKESSVEWYSSNPSVISCTEDGIIEGLSAGDYADITCKAKIGSTKETVRVYCVESIGEYTESEFTDFLTLIYKQPFAGSLASVHVSRKFLYSLFYDFIEIISPFFSSLMINTSTTNEVLFTGGKCQVMGRYGSFAYIAVANQSTATDGFVKYTHLDKEINGFLNLSATDMDVWANGITYDNRKLTTTYKGEVEWVVGNEDYITFDETTGQIVGVVPGQTTTITAKADGMTAKCTIHLLYKWPQAWTAKTNKQTYIYQAEGNKYEEGMALAKGETFVVQGDCGTDNGWAYGYYSISDNDKIWGYIPIADVSTKGTVSQYSNLGWIWPVRDVKNSVTQTTKARYISSPYGWRDTDPARHKGIDITNGISSSLYPDDSVDGYEVVSAFAGKVIYVCEDKNKSCGYCVAIRSTEKDPITGKYYVAIYMHLKYIPDVELNENVSSNKKLGYVGSTGNSGGSHLHFEVNNQNLSYGQKIYYENDSDKEMVFGSVINPLFFYMNYYNLPESDSSKIKINPTCDAMDYRKPLWYGDDIKESKEP